MAKKRNLQKYNVKETVDEWEQETFEQYYERRKREEERNKRWGMEVQAFKRIFTTNGGWRGDTVVADNVPDWRGLDEPPTIEHNWIEYEPGKFRKQYVFRKPKKKARRHFTLGEKK